MKNYLFRNFTALLLSGTMLAGVGCKDYDDDIDNINKRLDAMEIELSSVPEQIEAIKGSIPDLTDLTSRVAALEGSSIDSEGLKKELEALQTTLENYVDTEIGKFPTVDAMTETLKQTFATLTALTNLETAITGENGAIDQAIAEAITALKADVKNWLGPTMSEYLTDYATKSYVSSNESVTAILKEIQEEQDKYKDALQEIISGAIVGEDGTIKIGKVGKEQLDAELKELIDKIEPLSKRVAELEGRIQSLVYVPSTLEEAQTNTIMFEGASWIDFAGTNYYLGLADQQSAIITFRVSPASLVSKITSDNISIVTEKIATRAAAFTAELVEDSADPETGKFQVRATTDYKYGATDNETLAIALNVNIAPADDSESTQGIDYTSAFIATDYTAGGKINDKLVIAKAPAEEDGTYTTIALSDNQGTMTGTYNSELKYNSTETVTFMDGFTVYYKPDANKEVYYALSDMWENAPSIKISKPTKAATINPTTHKDNYTVSATSATIETPSTDLIDETITSDLFTYSISANNKTLQIGKVNQEIKIVGDNTAAVAKDVAMHWQYAIVAASGDYTATNVELSTKLDYKVYNQISTYKEGAGDGQYTVAVTKNGQAVTDGSITGADITLTAKPSVDDDIQYITVTLKGSLKVGGEYVVVATYKNADKTTVTITAKVNVTGMPEIAAYEIKAAEKAYVDSYTFDLQQNYASVLWNDNLKDAFGTQNDFETFIYGITNAKTDNDGGKAKATLAKNNKNIQVTFDTDAAYGTAYKPSITFTDATTGFAVTFKSTVTLVKLTASLNKEDSYFSAGGYAVAETSLTGTTLSVTRKPLAGAYSYNGDEKYKEDVKIVYSINESEEDLKGLTTPPSIDGSNILTWGDWKKLQLNVKADLVMVSDESRILDTKEFIVAIKDPVAEGNITVNKDAAMIYVADAQTLNIASLLTLAAQKDSAIDPETNVFDSTQSDGLNANLKTALTGGAAYKTINGNSAITVDEKTGVLTVQESGLAIQQPIVVTVQVDYTYKYGTRTTGEFTITVNPGTKPVTE